MLRIRSYRRRQARLLPPGGLDGGLPIGKLIAPFMNALKCREQDHGKALLGKWEAIMGKGVAAHTRPGRLANGELTVFVDSSVWLSELQRYAHREMLANLQKACGADAIRKVRLQLDPGS